MDFIDLQMALIVALILTAAAVVVFFDHRVSGAGSYSPYASNPISIASSTAARRPQVFDTRAVRIRSREEA